VIAAVGTALATGLLFGLLPARRAAALDPVLALAKR
jgi:putative ABC transport system permease protein